MNGWRFGAAVADRFSGARTAFSGLLHRWEKVRKFAGHSARKVRGTQSDAREHIKTLQNTQ